MDWLNTPNASICLVAKEMKLTAEIDLYVRLITGQTDWPQGVCSRDDDVNDSIKMMKEITMINDDKSMYCNSEGQSSTGWPTKILHHSSVPT